MKTETVLARGSILLVARVVQMGLGMATFLLVARSLGPAGYGEYATAAAIGGSVATLLDAALVDAAVVAGEAGVAALARQVAVWVSGATGLATAACFALGRVRDLAPAILAVGILIAVTASTSDRVAHARRRGDSRALSFARVSGAALGLMLAVVLVELHASWGPLTLVLAAPAGTLLWLPRRPEESRATSGVALSTAWRLSAPFLVSQGAWMVTGQAPILLTRAIAGASAAGEYGALIRLLDILSLVGPIMANFALPAFVTHFQAGRAGRTEAARLNALIALGGVCAVTVGAQAGWWFWRLTYPGVPFPASAFALLACAAGISQACGLPDRVLQGAGKARTVSVVGVCAAAAMLGVGVPAISALGLVGAGVARVAAAGLANLSMLAAAELPAVGKAANVSLLVPVLLAAALLHFRIGEGSYSSSVLLGVAAAVVTLGVAFPGYRAIRSEQRGAAG